MYPSILAGLTFTYWILARPVAAWATHFPQLSRQEAVARETSVYDPPNAKGLLVHVPRRIHHVRRSWALDLYKMHVTVITVLSKDSRVMHSVIQNVVTSQSSYRIIMVE